MRESSKVIMKMILEERVGYKAVGKRKLMKRRELDGSMLGKFWTKKRREELSKNNTKWVNFYVEITK